VIRARFQLVGVTDPRPVVWPIKHPYWCTGYGDNDCPVIAAYADDEAGILRQWPEAELPLDVQQATEYAFTCRFPKPDWFQEPTGAEG
jgi:hypothetical protein